MNQQFFNIKRAHYSVLRQMRRPLAQFGLTPARFDLMHALNHSYYFTYQSSLHRALGVCRSVVSRMLRSLEKLGMITRSRPSKAIRGDQRRLLVRLTDKGRQAVCDAYRCLRRAAQRLLEYAIVRAFTGHGWTVDDGFRATCELEALLEALRADFGDTATLSYPWHPDD